MDRSVRIIDIAGDLYNIKQLNGNTAKNRKMIRDLYTIGIQTLDEFQKIFKPDEDGKKLIEKYFKHGYDENKLNVDDNDKEKLIEVLTTGLNYYKNQIDIIEKLNKLKNYPSPVRDYIVIKKYNSIAELIHNIENAKQAIQVYEPIDDDKLYKILVHTAWYLTHSKSKQPASIKQLILDIDNTDVSIQDIVDGIKQLKQESNSKRNTRKKRYSDFIMPFDFMDENDSYTAGIGKMTKTQTDGKMSTTQKNTKGGAKSQNILTPFIHLYRYLDQ
jgi:hypothetical protein